MLFAHLSLVAFVSTLIGTVAAVPKISFPGGSASWWVAGTDNNLIWDCSDKTHDQFNVVIQNTNPSVLTAPLTIIPTLQNYICSKTVTTNQLSVTPATGYTVHLTNIFNSSDIYSSSEPFEIKAVGSPYPTATPGFGSSSLTPSSTASGSSPSNTTTNNTSNNSGGSKSVLSALGAFAAIVVGVMTA